MIITTCDTIPGKELEYIGLVTRYAVPLAGISAKLRSTNADKFTSEIETELSTAATGKGADAIVGVKFVELSQMIVAVGTAVKFK